MKSSSLTSDVQNPLDGFLQVLITGSPIPLDCEDVPPWFEPGRNCEVSVDVFSYFLNVLQPRWTNGGVFAFVGNSGPVRLFWQQHGRFFGRELTAAETVQFCYLIGERLRP